MEILDKGKAAKFYTLNTFEFNINSELIFSLVPSLTIKKKNSLKE
ncbi:hypothetical protein [Lysinibacillus sphaericus]|nr:hypothetical protein [Lysinibacillus sphaericus]